MSGLGVALGGALIVGVAAAVVVITDTSEVGAYLADAGTVPAAGNRCDDDADNVCIVSADGVVIAADRTSTLHASTFGDRGRRDRRSRCAVAVAEVKGSTTRLRRQGRAARPFRDRAERRQRRRSRATTIASVGPFGDAKTMSVGISAAILGVGGRRCRGRYRLAGHDGLDPRRRADPRVRARLGRTRTRRSRPTSRRTAARSASSPSVRWSPWRRSARTTARATAEHGITRASLGARAVIRSGAASLTARSGAAATGADGLGRRAGSSRATAVRGPRP